MCGHEDELDEERRIYQLPKTTFVQFSAIPMTWTHEQSSVDGLQSAVRLHLMSFSSN